MFDIASAIDSSFVRETMKPTTRRIAPIQNQILNLWRQYQTRRRDMTSCSLSASSAP